MSSVNLETGASGTPSKRRPQAAARAAVDRARELDVDLALEVGDDVGKLVRGVGAQVDLAGERRAEQRRLRLRGADRDPAGQASAANWGRVQTSPMWDWSSSSFFGIVTTVRAMFASPSPVCEDGAERRVPAALRVPAQPQRELRREGQRRAVRDLEVGARDGRRRLRRRRPRCRSRRGRSWSG